MRRALVLSLMVLAAVVVLVPAAGAAPGHTAKFTFWNFDIDASGTTLRDVTVEVSCPSGSTFLGRVSLRSGGDTVFSGRIKGTCTGSPVTVHTFNETASKVPCGQEMDLGGQVRSSDQVKFFIKKVNFISCI